MSRVPDEILIDLARKAAGDAEAAVRRTASLLNTPQDLFYIALSATASCAGAATGYAQLCAGNADPEEAVDALWSVLRPMVLMVAGGGSADFRALLRQAPKARKRT